MDEDLDSGGGTAEGDSNSAHDASDHEPPDHDPPDHESSDSGSDPEPLDSSDTDRFDRATGAQESDSTLSDRASGVFGPGAFDIDDPFGLRDEPKDTGFHLLGKDPADLLMESLETQSGERVSNWFGLDMDAASAGLKSMAEFAADFFAAIGDFWQNYSDMKAANTKGADRFFHCQANCQAASRGPGGLLAGQTISEVREAFDLPKNMIKGMSYKDSLADCDADMAANRTGWDAGSRGLRCNDACNGFRPRGL